jgi:hypothetical protein
MTRIPVGRGRRGPGILSVAVASFVTLAVAIGCGQTTSPTPSGGSAAAVGPSASPGSSAGGTADTSPGGSADGAPTPRPTAWPGNAVLGITALGVADGQILAAVNDFKTGITTENLALMRKAADGLTGLDVLLPNLDKINIFEPMRSFADRYGAAIRSMISSATALRSAIDAKDAAAITTASEALIASLSLYSTVQPELAAWVEQSTTQQKLLLR